MSISEIKRFDGATLAAFCAVAEELSFARAASRLCISQPPLSRRIRQLEEEIGTQLFERTTRSVSLTPAGALMYEHARRITNEAGQMMANVREMVRGQGGSLSIGITPSASVSPLVGHLHKFRLKHPNVSLDLIELDSVQLREEFKYGKLDLALMRPVSAHSSIEMTVVHAEPLCFVTRKEDALPGGSISPAQLTQYPLIGYDAERSPYLANLFKAVVEMSPETPRVVQRSRLPSILTLVEAGVGAALAPRCLREWRPGVLHFHELVSAPGVTAEMVVARPAGATNPTALAFIGSLLAQK